MPAGAAVTAGAAAATERAVHCACELRGSLREGACVRAGGAVDRVRDVSGECLFAAGQTCGQLLEESHELPAAADFDPRVTLDAMLTPGEDRSRWQHSRAGAIEGCIVRVHDAEVESANCLSGTRLDAHIEVALRPDAPPNERVIVEITPPMREWAASRGVDWSTGTLRRQLTGRRARIEGWLLFDDEHDEESENTRPGHRGNWRATAWEVHPVMAIVVSDPGREDAHAHRPWIHTSALMRPR